MSTKSPVFPMPQLPQHFSDYGFDPQMDYLQVLEEARKHKRESSSRSIDALHFKLQKPISKEDYSKKNKNKKKKWWRNALLFWRWKWAEGSGDGGEDDRYVTRSRAYIGAAFSGPVYITESRSGSVTPCRTRSGPIGGTLPYVSLRELNMMQEEEQECRISASPMPIYLVT